MSRGCLGHVLGEECLAEGAATGEADMWDGLDSLKSQDAVWPARGVGRSQNV